jgi:molybdopterin molybdotransferase
VTHACDDPGEIQAAVEECLDADLALICGGVSVGAHDHVKGALAALGVECVFAGVALKPGKPAWFGTRGTTLVFGLPGNPVSSVAGFVLLAAPALRALGGRGEGQAGVGGERAAVRGRLTQGYAKPPDVTHALPCAATTASDGRLLLTPATKRGSHILTSLLGADAFALIAPDRTEVRAGDSVDLEPIGRSL